MKPIIGITLDREETGSFSAYPHYALRVNYFDSVIKAGGLPIGIPYSNQGDLKKYYDMIDGLLIPGGGFDIPPALYGENEVHETVCLKECRTNFEYEITALCLKNNKPMLGICGGMQLINVCLGGSLIQDIPTHFESKINVPHYAKDRCAPAHNVKVEEKSRLFDIIKTRELGVNTSHHQGVKKLGNGLKITAVADDGMVEGIELPTHKFCLGVQWHPEYEVSPADFAIIEAFVAACRR